MFGLGWNNLIYELRRAVGTQTARMSWVRCSHRQPLRMKLGLRILVTPPGLGSLLSSEDRQPSETLLFDVIHDVLCRVGSLSQSSLHDLTSVRAARPTPLGLSQICQRPSDTVMDVWQAPLRNASRANIGGSTTGVNRLIFIQIFGCRAVHVQAAGEPEFRRRTRLWRKRCCARNRGAGNGLLGAIISRYSAQRTPAPAISQ